jgi:hypothetical protein
VVIKELSMVVTEKENMMQGVTNIAHYFGT